MYLSIYRSIYLSLSLFHPQYLPLYLSIYLAIYLSLSLSLSSVYLSGCLPVYPAEQTWGHRDALSIVIVSHIEHSSKNLDNLLRIYNQYRQIADEGLITSIFVTRERCGIAGKAATIWSYTLNYQIPSALVDDNHEVIAENSEEVHTCHIHIRRKPKCPAAETLQHYLLDCAAPLERLLWRYRHR